MVVEQSWSSICIRFAVAPQAESGQHFEECQGFGGRWHGPGDGYPTDNCCQPTLGTAYAVVPQQKIRAAVMVARQSWPPPTDMLGSDLPCHRSAAVLRCEATREPQHAHDQTPFSNLPSVPLLSHTAHHACQPLLHAAHATSSRQTHRSP
eukprot:scaffold11727_cov60-Phaeocystis_antarctica.AAC.2